ncbi:uncharacterized protein LOC131941766 [Physella acuta]|uniref:uncharacterized protein LOC131941766 n=1 Tax=Physella acuta TaxID=109671 RepID=UPI0027DC8376|nr:uncharacterized protein LOC131941766 [Physella acuta]
MESKLTELNGQMITKVGELDERTQDLDSRCMQVKESLQAKVNQLLSETEETKTAIKQCKQDTQEVKQVQTDINNQISATRSKQSYFQIKVDQLVTKINKCEEKCRMLST